MSKTEQALRKAEEERGKRFRPPTAKKELPKESPEEDAHPRESNEAAQTAKRGGGSRLRGFFGGLFGRRKKSEEPSEAGPAPLPVKRPQESVRVMPRIVVPAPVEPPVAVPTGGIEDGGVAEVSETILEEKEFVLAGGLEIEDLEHLIFIGREKEKPNPQ
jgi:hypothetical protein